MDRAAIDELIDLAYDFARTRRVNEFVDVDRLMMAIEAGTEPSRVGRAVARFVIPTRQRVLERLQKSTVKLSAWLPDPVREAMALQLGQPVKLPRKMIEEAVASERVRENVRTMMQETMSSIIERAFNTAPAGTGRGLRGAIGLGARVAGAATRGVFGGLADEVQRQLEERVKDAIDSMVGMVQKRIVEKMTSEETAKQLGLKRRQAFLDLMQQDEPVVAKFFSRAPWLMLDALVPAVVAHNWARAEVREAVRAEVEATLTELSTQTIGELLDELGLSSLLRDGLHQHLAPLVEQFIATPAFAGWIKQRS